jgi:hypothetical protein
MANKVVAYNSGTVTAYGTKYGNNEVGNVANNYRVNTGGLTWYNSPTYGNDYVMISNSYDLGYSTQGNAKPLFWVASSDADFLAIVNKLNDRKGQSAFDTVANAIIWINASNKYYLLNQPSSVPSAQFHYDPGNTSSYSGSGTVLNNIGLVGNATGAVGTLSGVAYESGTASGAFNFDGASDIITFGQYNFGNTITVNAWVYPRTEASINTLMSNCAANTNTNGFKMAWNNWQTTNYTMNFEAGNGSVGNTSSTANNTVVVNTWQMLTFVFNKTTPSIKFYKNGSEIATASGGAPVASIGTNNSNWWMGSIGGNSYQMNANMGIYKIWTSNLATSEILAEYNATKSRYGV